MSDHREGAACPLVQSVLAKLSLCRTSVLGGRLLKCDECDSKYRVYNSCGDRHCPQCSGAKRYNFSERASSMLLDGVDYFQVVFTMPSELSKLALRNREGLTKVLFHSAWKSLKKTIQKQQGYDPAAIMVLHTWNQQLGPHWHVHALVPGAGPSLEGHQWKVGEAPDGSPFCGEHYLVDATTLRETFRKFALAHLNRLRAAGDLQLPSEGEHGDLNNDDDWKRFIEMLESKEWVTYIEPPPVNSSGPEDLVRYLTRYLTGGPISDSRIVDANDREVTFMAREGNKTGGERKQVPVTLSTTEFTRRWCLHIQPDQLTKSRYFGGWANNRRVKYLDRCASSMDAAKVSVSADALEFEVEKLSQGEQADCRWSGDTRETIRRRCPKCDRDSLREIAVTERPSWRDIFARGSDACPPWYAESLEKDDREFWDGCMGEGFYDWYLEMLVESAWREPERPGRPKAHQPRLPGLSGGNYCGLE